jgi:hypothetical protein
VRAGPSVVRPTDIRYDGGLLRAKLRNSDGNWFDLIPTRPRIPIDGKDSAGPLIIRNDAGTAVFEGDRIRAEGENGLLMTGGYRRLRGRPGVSRSADERFRPIDCGVQVAFPVRKGDVVEYSVFLRKEGDYSLSDDGRVISGGTVVTATPEPRVVIGHKYRSATDPDVIRARLRWSAEKRAHYRVRICAEE